MAITKRSIELEIPDADMFEDADPEVGTIPVPYVIVTGAIDALQAVIAQWKKDDGCERDDETWGPLMEAAGLALGGLVGAYSRKRAEQSTAVRRHVQETIIANRAFREQEQQ